MTLSSKAGFVYAQAVQYILMAKMENIKMIANKIDYGIAIKQLNEWTKAYDEGRPLVSDKEWDDLYFEVEDFENKTGIIFDDSPTQNISYDVINELKKVKHNHLMLSLEKTKSVEELASIFKNKTWIAMSKLDGLSCSLLYKKGKLYRAETRGNGEIGEDVTHNAKVVENIPKEIPITYQDIVIDGEIICKKFDFEEFQDEYKNPRNFASGSIRLLDSRECKKRKLSFIAWDAIKGIDGNTLSFKLHYLSQLGFEIARWTTSDAPIQPSIEYAINFIKEQSKMSGYPIDGVVFKLDNIKEYEDYGMTSHGANKNAAIAYKFYEETYTSYLKNIDFSMGRTGILTPVAIFNPIEIDGSTVERASLHNLSIMEQTLGKTPFVGQQVEVFKAMQIIPQIESADFETIPNIDKIIHIPTICPVCGEPLEVRYINETKNLYCSNGKCPSRYVNVLDHMFGTKGLDIKGISKMTMEKLIDWGWMKEPVYLFKLREHAAEWYQKSGFGEKSVERILLSIKNNSKNVPVWRVISAAGIPQVGTTASKQLANYFKTWQAFREAVDNKFDFTQLQDFGEVADYEIKHFDYSAIDRIVPYLTFEDEAAPVESNRADLNKTFVITGKLKGGNRDWLKNKIEAAGGKVASSVSTKTDYLINNDINSTSSKNVKAKSLNIPIITENEVLKMLGE